EVVGTLQLDRPRRDRGNERLLEAVRAKRCLEVRDIGLHRRLASVRDGSSTHRVDHLQLWLARRGRRILRAALDLAIRVREPLSVAATGGAAAAARQVRAQLEAG